MKPKTLLIILLVAGIKISGYGQIRINGRVIAASDKQPIANASVSVLGKNIGTVTNDEGRFSLIAPITNTDSLAIDYLGYKLQKIACTTIKEGANVTIQLDTMVQKLTEIIIRPLTLKQILDSIIIRNQIAFLSPMKLNGYYREFVFTNNKCTEYADALTTFFKAGNKSSYDGQLKIVASRCAEAKEDNKKDSQSAKEFYIESKVPPNKLFEYVFLNGLLDKFLPAEALPMYSYSMESIANSTDRIIIITPKPSANKNLHRLTFNVSENFELRSYRIDIEPKRVKDTPERSLLGIHVKILNQYLEVDYQRLGEKIYPKFFKYDVTLHIGGKFWGTAFDQTYNPRSEYVTTDFSSDKTPLTRSETYKKGNLCDNGVAINDVLLKEHNFITPSRKDSLAISSMK